MAHKIITVIGLLIAAVGKDNRCLAVNVNHAKARERLKILTQQEKSKEMDAEQVFIKTAVACKQWMMKNVANVQVKLLREAWLDLLRENVDIPWANLAFFTQRVVQEAADGEQFKVWAANGCVITVAKKFDGKRPTFGSIRVPNSPLEDGYKFDFFIQQWVDGVLCNGFLNLFLLSDANIRNGSTACSLLNDALAEYHDGTIKAMAMDKNEIDDHYETRKMLAEGMLKFMQALAGIFNTEPGFLGCTPEIVNHVFPAEIDEGLQCLDHIALLEQIPALRGTYRIILRNKVVLGTGPSVLLVAHWLILVTRFHPGLDLRSFQTVFA